jgi:hypothetical protein
MTDRTRLLEMALKGLEVDRAILNEEILEIKRELGHRPVAMATAAVSTAPAKRHTMSAEARKRISEGMKRRYAELRRTNRKQR